LVRLSNDSTLRAAGVKEAAIHKLLVDNPLRFLAFVPKKTT